MFLIFYLLILIFNLFILLLFLMINLFNSMTLDSLDSYLVNEGFDVLLCGGLCPFQIEANHPSGFSIYFRSRGTIASLRVYSSFISDSLNKDHVIWESYFDCFEPFEAGWISDSFAFYLFYSLWTDSKDFILYS